MDKVEMSKPGPKRRSGPKKVQRTDLTLPPSVVEAAVLHAKDLKIPQVEYWNNAIGAYFRVCLLNPPEPVKVQCEHCGARIREPRSRWKRLRLSTQWKGSSMEFLEGVAGDYFNGNWSRALEAAVRAYLGDRNPAPEGKGKIMGVKLAPGRKASGEEPVRAQGGRPITIEGLIRKHGGKA
jgi:hypothetical protein